MFASLNLISTYSCVKMYRGTSLRTLSSLSDIKSYRIPCELSTGSQNYIPSCFFFFLKYCYLNKQKSSLSVISVCVCVYSYVCGWKVVGVCAFVCVCQGQVSVLRTVPDFLRESLARIGSGSAESWKLPGPRAPGAPLSSLLQVWGHRLILQSLLFFKVLSWGPPACDAISFIAS